MVDFAEKDVLVPSIQPAIRSCNLALMTCLQLSRLQLCFVSSLDRALERPAGSASTLCTSKARFFTPDFVPRRPGGLVTD